MLDFKTNPLLTEIEQIIDGQTCTLVPDAEAAILPTPCSVACYI
jgi:hypothetical protein